MCSVGTANNKLHNKNNQNNTPQTIERKINIKEEIKLAKQQKQEKNKNTILNNTNYKLFHLYHVYL